ncbi:MAG: ROK family protein [Chloroflexi bacterium]|nr:ROK family protein [Chloroflexota bacterium]
MTDHIVAIDLGGTKFRLALCESNGRIVQQIAHETRAPEGAEAVFTRMVAAIRDFTGGASIRGIGLSAPGPLDARRGVILQAPNIPGIDGFPIKTRFENAFGAPTFIGNDANLAALGEHQLGAGRGVAHMIYVTISTGIGGGIIVDNQLLLGARGFAGEIGHQTLDAFGPLCNCGNIGCLEALASGPAIAKSALDEIRKGRESNLLDLVKRDHTKITANTVAQAARGGDKLSCRMFERAGFFIGLGLVNLLHTFDTQLFVLGGGIAINTWDLFYNSMLMAFDKYTMKSMRGDVRIVPAQLGDDAGLVGAAALVNGQMADSK